MKLRNRVFFFALFFFIVSSLAYSLEFGIIGGNTSNPSETTFGFSAGFGFIVPLVKMEVEYYNLNDRAYEALTAGVKLRKKLGKLAPYAVIGVGAEFEKVTFRTSEYNSFLFVGGGAHLFLNSLISFRADIRFLNFSGKNKTRLTLGAFFHL